MDTLIKTIVLKCRRAKNSYQAVTADGLILIVDQEFDVPAWVEAKVVRFWSFNNVVYAQAELMDIRSFRTLDELKGARHA